MTAVDEFTTIAAKPTPPTSVLRGPADAGHYRVQVGRYGDRWYTDPLPTCPIAPASEWQGPAISTVKKASGQDWSFVAVKRIAMSDELTDIGRLARDQRHERVRSLDKVERDRAFKRGANVHLIAEALLYGQPCPIGPNDPGYTYRAAVEAFFDAHQPELVAAEFVAIHRNLNGVGYGGTSDALIRINGKLLLVDWKSRGDESKHGAYPEEAAQVSAYTTAEYMIVEGPNGAERRAMPAIDGGLIVSIKTDGYEVYPVDTVVGAEHWTALHAWWVARRDERKALGRKWAPAPRRADPVDRLGPLQARYREMSDPDKQSFLDMKVDPADLDAIELALDDIFAFRHIEPPTPQPPPPRPTVVPPVQPPDEGGPVDDDTFAVLEQAYAELDGDATAWLKQLIVEGNEAGLDWRAQHHHTLRRYELYRGLITLAASPYMGDGVNEILEALVWAVSRDAVLFHDIPLGAAIGHLDHLEAAELSAAVDDLLAGRRTFIVDETTKTLRLTAA